MEGSHMKKLLVAVLLSVAMMSGCSMLNSTTKGSRIVNDYDDTGKIVRSTTEEVPIGDKYFDYQSAVSTVVKEKAKAVSAKVTAIKEMVAPKPGESSEAAAYKTAAGMVLLGTVDASAAAEIQAIHFGKDGYDVAASAVGVVGDAVKVGAGVYGAVKLVEKVGQYAGDKVTIGGEGNTYAKTTQISEEHAYTSGDNSPVSPSTDQGTEQPATTSRTEETTTTTTTTGTDSWNPTTTTSGTAGTVAP